jgi:hypothetical protein
MAAHIPVKKLVHSVFGKINYGSLKHNSLYLGLVLPSGPNVIKLFTAVLYTIYSSKHTSLLRFRIDWRILQFALH